MQVSKCIHTHRHTEEYVIFCVYSDSAYRRGLQFDYEDAITYDTSTEDNQTMKTKVTLFFLVF